jgi:hypothetical protein
MKAKLRWLCVLPLAVAALFFVLFGVALGQGPVLTTLPTPTPMAFGPDVVSSSDLGAQDTLPDLVVTKIETGPPVPLAGRSSVISVTIKNQGPGNVLATNNYYVDLYIDPPFDPIVGYHQIDSPSLGLPWGAQGYLVANPGASYVFTTTWVFTDVKTFDIWAQVDSDDTVTETNEANNTKGVSVSALTAQHFRHDTHQDFLTNMASTLDNSDPSGMLRLGLFAEPPFLAWPFTNGSCQITSDSVTMTDYNMESPDKPINQVMTGTQVVPQLVANGEGVVVAVWEDGRDGDVYNRDIYLRYSTDEGQTWEPEMRVNDDPIGNHVNQLNPAAALSKDGNLLVAWQDYRNGNYDIYAQRFLISGTDSITPDSEGNILVGVPGVDTIGDQRNPDIAVDEAGDFHVAWQDSRNGSYDIFATSYISTTGSYVWSLPRRVHDDFGASQQENPAIEVLDWRKVTGIDYTVAITPPYTVTVTGVISKPSEILVVAWEDNRNGNADIAMVASGDGGETFGVDQFITHSGTDGDQRNPDVALTKGTAKMNYALRLPNGSDTTVEVDVPAGDIHTVWEGYSTLAESDRDIYYNQSQLKTVQIGTSNTFRFELSVGTANEKINQNDSRAWQTTPVDQSGPALTAVPCGVDPEAEDWNLFITWADGRNYDSFNYDIYYTVKSSCAGMPEGLASNIMLNDGVRLRNFDATDPSYDDYDAGSPPPGYQVNPGIAADIRTDWPLVLGGYVYLAWQDDRAGDPQDQTDIYFARSNLTFFKENGPHYGIGSQISDVLDSGSDDTIWYTIDWSAAKPSSTYVTVQTRLGDTIADVLTSEWYPQRFAYQPQPGDCLAVNSGAPLPGYDAPGQHIENAAGTFWPQARYIQYRVNFFTRDSTHTPELDALTIYFDNGIRPDDGDNGVKSYIYLPMVLK